MSLNHALGPIETESFYGEYWEKMVLHVSASDTDKFSSLGNDLRIENIIWRSCREWGDISLAKSKTNYESVKYGNTQPKYEDILSAYAEGFTIVINNMQNKNENIATYCRAIENEMFCRITANLYLTQKESQGLDPHYDDDDVIVLQLEGKKIWSIYDSEISLPLRDSNYLEPEIPNEAKNRYMLSKGDLLYIPRGVVHDARSYDEQSMHLTISLRTITWVEVLTKTLTSAANRNTVLRQSIPTNLSKFGRLSENDFDELKYVISNLDRTSLFNALDNCRNELLRNVGDIPSNDINTSPNIAIDENGIINRYILSKNLIYSLDHRAEGIYLTAPSGILNFENKYDSALMFVLSGDVFASDDVPFVEKCECKLLIQHLLSYGVLERYYITPKTNN